MNSKIIKRPPRGFPKPEVSVTQPEEDYCLPEPVEIDENLLFEIGRAGGPHGLNGKIKLYLHFPLIDISHIKTVFFSTEEAGKFRRFSASWRPLHKTAVCLQLEAVENRKQAELLKNTILFVNRSDVDMSVLLDESGVSPECVGFAVFDGEKKLGIVDAIDFNGQYWVLNVSTDGGGDFILPGVKEYIVRIDMASKSLYIDVPRGFFEI